jgi:hypothetical protein
MPATHSHCNQPVVSRHDRAALRYRREMKFKAHVFRLNLWRMDLTDPQRDIASLICEDTFDSGYTSQVYLRLEDLVQESGAVSPVLNYGRNDISEALNGKKGKDGLVHFGIVRVERQARGNDFVWLLSPVADASLWRCGERIQVSRLESRKGALDELRRQCVPFLATLEPAPDLWDAMDSSEVLFATDEDVGALKELPSNTPPRTVGSSEFQNNNFQKNTPDVPNFTTPVKQLTGNNGITVQQLNSYGDVREMLIRLRHEFERAHGHEASRKEMDQYGGCWRKLAQLYPQVFTNSLGELKYFNDKRERFKTTAWHWFRSDIYRQLEVKTWDQLIEKARVSSKKNKESLTNT